MINILGHKNNKSKRKCGIKKSFNILPMNKQFVSEFTLPGGKSK